jgi:hypothetical protein
MVFASVSDRHEETHGMPQTRASSIDYFYGGYGEIEDAFLAAIDTSLQPRSPDMLYDVVADLKLDAATPCA